jgi:hypothetical protein
VVVAVNLTTPSGDFTIATALRYQDYDFLLALRQWVGATHFRRRDRFIRRRLAVGGTCARSLDAERADRLDEAFKSQHTDRSGLHQVADRCTHPLADENLAIIGLIA